MAKTAMQRSISGRRNFVRVFIMGLSPYLKKSVEKARRRAQNKKCAAGRLRTKNAGLHLLPHNHFAWYALYVEEREKRDRIFTEKNTLYLHIA